MGLGRAGRRRLGATVGGDPKPTSHILASCLKGRILARRDQQQAAGVAFEEAVSLSEKYGFWLLAAMGIVVTTGAWFWLAIVGLEETTEQPKALASGTTMTGTALFFGVVPLVAVHLVGFAILMSYGASRRHNRQSGLWLGAGATIAASSIGLTVLLLFLYA